MVIWTSDARTAAAAAIMRFIVPPGCLIKKKRALREIPESPSHIVSGVGSVRENTHNLYSCCRADRCCDGVDHSDILVDSKHVWNINRWTSEVVIFFGEDYASTPRTTLSYYG